MNVTPALSAALGVLSEEFEVNELARELMVSKGERTLCDALAARLCQALANESGTVVIREWGLGVRELGRRRVDLAVCRDGGPVALIEAKVARTFDLAVQTERRYPSKPIQSDIEKLRSVETGAQRYVVLFVTHNHGIPEVGDDEVPYLSQMRSHGVIDQETIDHGLERVHRVFAPEVFLCARGRVTAGRAFGVKVTLFYRLYLVR